MPNQTVVPQSIGVILDGNRRWARAKGLSVFEGHRAGYNKMKEFIGWARDAGVRAVIAYVFSTENWGRAPEEVSYLMNLLREALAEREISAYKKENIKIRVIGDRTMLEEDMRTWIARAEEHTKDQSGMTLVFLLSYGGRREIVYAASRLVELIRAGGERRLSNFLLWQAAYSELMFISTLWPDFSKEEFCAILDEYAKRERRFGA